MNELTDYILEPGSQLYRYDIIQPPKEWSTDYTNPEYSYPHTGSKNQIGAFFFFNSAYTALETGKCALVNEKKKGVSYHGIWLTKCVIKTSVKLLDLRDSIVCIELLAALNKAGFTIYSDELKSWDGIPFSKLANIIQPVEDIVLLDTSWVNNEETTRKVQKSIMEMQKTLKIENTHIGHLLQLLTDFSNGFYFRKVLLDKGYEGYIFNETNRPFSGIGTDTICIFDSTKFQPPCIEASITRKEAETSLDNICLL